MFREGRDQDAEKFYEEYCEGESQCDIPIDLSDAGPLSEKCNQTLIDRREASRYKDKSTTVINEQEGLEDTQTECKDKENAKDDSSKNCEEGTVALPEPVITVQALCVSASIEIPFTDYKIAKDDFGLFIVIVDFVVIISIMAFIQILEQRQLEYIEQFKR